MVDTQRENVWGPKQWVFEFVDVDRDTMVDVDGDGILLKSEEVNVETERRQ